MIIACVTMPDHPQEYVERLQQEGKVLYQMWPQEHSLVQVGWGIRW